MELYLGFLVLSTEQWFILMHEIHPSLFRRQISEYTEELLIATRDGLDGEDAYIKERIQDFRARYSPWEGLFVDEPRDIFNPRHPAVLILEQVGLDWELYPSDAPWQTNLFITKDEALQFAAKNYRDWEVTAPSDSVSQEVVTQIFSEVFC